MPQQRLAFVLILPLTTGHFLQAFRVAAPSTLIFEAALSMSRRSSGVSSTAAAPMFSSRRSSLVVPGIGRAAICRTARAPGIAHYIIHAYDYPPLAQRALDAARRYAKIAPDSPHALHMPSHIFTRLGLWQESIDSNLASVASAQKNNAPGNELHAKDLPDLCLSARGPGSRGETSARSTAAGPA